MEKRLKAMMKIFQCSSFLLLLTRRELARKGPLTGRKGGAMEHNACDLLAGATSSPWQHLKAAVKCQSVAMLRRVMWGA